MNNHSLIVFKNKAQSYWYNVRPIIKIASVRIFFIFLLFILVSNQEISFHIFIGTPVKIGTIYKDDNQGIVMNTSNVTKKWWQEIKEEKNDIRNELNLANVATAVGVALSQAEQVKAAKYSNLGFILSPTYARENNIDPEIVAYKNKQCFEYIELYASTAIKEASLYGIPAAITLAQGLLESNAGDSKLAQKENNHFGIKCKSKCIGCRCANYTDDSKYDMFRIFDSVWHSFREHSKLLSGPRYKHLTRLPKSEYKNWAHGLEAAGYATDKQYAEKLIKIIEALKLQRFD